MERDGNHFSVHLWRENLLVAPSLPAKSNGGFSEQGTWAPMAREKAVLSIFFEIFSALLFQFSSFYLILLCFSGFLV
jgi:hypothetical protein